MSSSPLVSGVVGVTRAARSMCAAGVKCTAEAVYLAGRNVVDVDNVFVVWSFGSVCNMWGVGIILTVSEEVEAVFCGIVAVILSFVGVIASRLALFSWSGFRCCMVC